MKPSNLLRITGTAILYFLCGILSTFLTAESVSVLNHAAVGQLQDSDQAYTTWMMVNRHMNGGGVAIAVFLLGLITLWWAPLKSWKSKAPTTLLAAAVVISFLVMASPAHAYYDTTDRAEWVNIEANQSAFLIPAVGANKSGQAQFGSVEYLAQNKVAAKRVQIPHIVAANTAMLKDYYVPGATLYLVDRTPYTKEWVDATDRGTSVKKEGMRFESADSVDMTTGVNISASVSEEDAAKFFYNFGTNGVSTGQKPEDVFASVKYGKSLGEVMDVTVRAKVHQILALEFAKRKFMVAIGDKAAIITEVERQVKAEFSPKGITISFVGYAEGLSFDPKIQAAVNDSVIAGIQYASKDALLAVVEINKKNAEVDVIRAQADTMRKWNGAINFPFFIPDSLAQAIVGWFKK